MLGFLRAYLGWSIENWLKIIKYRHIFVLQYCVQKYLMLCISPYCDVISVRSKGPDKLQSYFCMRIFVDWNETIPSSPENILNLKNGQIKDPVKVIRCKRIVLESGLLLQTFPLVVRIIMDTPDPFFIDRKLQEVVNDPQLLSGVRQEVLVVDHQQFGADCQPVHCNVQPNTKNKILF